MRKILQICVLTVSNQGHAIYIILRLCCQFSKKNSLQITTEINVLKYYGGLNFECYV